MQHLVIVLTLILFITTPINANEGLQAYVKSEKALIYSDLEMQAPIGFISQNKSIIVSNTQLGPLKARRLFLKNGRVAYIAQSDLYFSDKGLSNNIKSTKELEHDIEYDSVKKEIDNFLSFKVGQLGVGEDLQSINNANNVVSDNMMSLQFSYERHNGENNFFFAVGPNFASFANDETMAQLITIQADGGFSVIRSKAINFDLITSFAIIPYLNVKIKNFDNQKVGSGFGYKYGARVHLFPQAQFSLFGEYLINRNSIYNLEELYIASDNPTVFSVESISGNSIMFGLSYKL